MVGGFCRVLGLLCVNRSDQVVIFGKSGEWAFSENLSEQRVSAPAQQPISLMERKKERKKPEAIILQNQPNCFIVSD